MHIVVIMRMTPDLAEEFDLNEDGTDIDREWTGIKLNEFDDHALEEAVIIKENTGATVSALAVAGDGVDRMLQSAVARGADRALRIDVEDEDKLDSRAATPVLAEAIKELGADLVITGVQTAEDVFGQLAPYLGAALGYPQVSAASGLVAGDGTISVRQEYSGGRSALIEVQLPAVVGLQTASQPPRYVSGSRLRQAMTDNVLETLTTASQPLANTAEVTSLGVPERSGGAEILEGTPEEIAGRIHAILLERGILKN